MKVLSLTLVLVVGSIVSSIDVSLFDDITTIFENINILIGH